jgi:HEAT repeat protein
LDSFGVTNRNYKGFIVVGKSCKGVKMTEQTQETSTESLLDQVQNSQDSYVRRWAADLLGERSKNNEQVLDVLRIVARSDKNASVRDAARDSLKKSGISIELSEKDKLSNTFWWAAFLILDLLVLILYALFGE